MKLKSWQALNAKEIKEIHEASLDILENTGLLIDSKIVRDILKGNGAVCDCKRVKFPRKLVEDCISKNQPTIQMTDREGRDLYLIGDGKVRFAGGHNAVFVLTNDDGARRNSVLKDIERYAILCDQLEDIDMVGVPLSPCDVPAETMLAHAVAEILRNTGKSVFFSSESRNVNLLIIELAKETTGFNGFKERSSMISQLSSTSPLYWETGASEALIECARAGMPVALLPQPISGLTAPYTLAGNIVVHNAEVLSGIVIAHIVNPCTPLIYAAAWTSYDMRYGNVAIGRPEEALMRFAGAQLAHYYNMPSHSIGPDADANVYDEQLGWEKMMSLIAAVMGGNDLIVNSGMFGTGMIFTNEQLLLDNEMNRFARRILDGINVNEDTIAKNVITEVGPRGIFLDHLHTIEHLRTGEHIEPTVITGMNYENWQASGSQDCASLAAGKAETMLSNPIHAKLHDSKVKALGDILERN